MGGERRELEQSKVAQGMREAPLPRPKAMGPPANMVSPLAQCKARNTLKREELAPNDETAVHSMTTSVSASRVAQDFQSSARSKLPD